MLTKSSNTARPRKPSSTVRNPCTAYQGEKQPRQLLREGDPGDQNRVAGQGSDEQRSGDQGDSVAEVRDRTRRPQLPVLRSETAPRQTSYLPVSVPETP